jgi:muramoyltetrapeptide carboxypeptidase LdcA involved in peptidoglycan recycling
LRVGDRVAVVAPSGPVDPVRLDAGCAALRELGLDVVLGKHVYGRVTLAEQGPVPPGWQALAGADAERAADIEDAWCDPEIRAVLCARGGYGATRVLDHLDWHAMSRHEPKILHGSSDITALHVAFGRRFGVTTSFGPMVASLLADREPVSTEHAKAALFGAGEPVTGGHPLVPGRAEGSLTGGNLALLAALIGTPYASEPAAGQIAFLEDVTEQPYRIDRMLVQLRQAGWFEGVAGIALGTWIECGDPAELAAVFRARLGPLGVPILAGLPVGHGPRQLTIELGARAELDADRGVLRQRL